MRMPNSVAFGGPVCPAQAELRRLSERCCPGPVTTVEQAHQCMTTGAIHSPASAWATSRMLDAFSTDVGTRREFLAMLGREGGSEK